MTIINFFCAALLVGCVTSWVWCFVNKWEVSEGCSIAQWLEIHGGRFVGVWPDAAIASTGGFRGR
jgi:hypothetical protein